jgi:hypothetical protein
MFKSIDAVLPGVLKTGFKVGRKPRSTGKNNVKKQ